MSLFPKNRWMNDANYLAAMAHVGWAALIVLSCWVLRGSVREVEGVTAAMVVFAAVKEFFYDARYELPKQTWRDNLSDFGEYLLGLGLAWGVLWVRWRLLRL